MNANCTQLIAQIEQYNQKLLDGLSNAEKDTKGIEQLINERLSLFQQLFHEQNAEWLTNHQDKLNKLKQDVADIENAYAQKRDNFREQIHQQKKVTKGVQAYQNIKK